MDWFEFLCGLAFVMTDEDKEKWLGDSKDSMDSNESQDLEEESRQDDFEGRTNDWYPEKMSWEMEDEFSEEDRKDASSSESDHSFHW